MRYLGLDLGTRTLGCSISDITGTIASTLKTIRFWGTKQKIKRREIKKRKILFVIPNKVSIFAPVK